MERKFWIPENTIEEEGALMVEVFNELISQDALLSDIVEYIDPRTSEIFGVIYPYDLPQD